MKASVFMARYLKSQGLECAFGLPGGEAISLMEGLQQVDIPFILSHHETTAGYMAGMTGLLTGVPGLCIVTRGPGAANMVNAVATAYLDRLPLLAISGDLEPSQVGSYTHQWLDLVSLFKPIAKSSSRLLAGEIETSLPQALELARSGKPGPVYFAFPGSGGNKELPDLGDMSVEEIGRCYGVAPKVEAEADLSGVIEVLRASKSPILMAGQGVAFSHTSAALVAAAEHQHVPVTVTARSKGCIPEDHPLLAGTFGVYTDAPICRLVQEADLILAVGLDGLEFLKPWKIQVPVVSVAPAGADDPSYSPRVAVDGDLPTLLATIRKEVERSAGWTLERIGQCRREVAAMMVPKIAEVKKAAGCGVGPLSPCC